MENHHTHDIKVDIDPQSLKPLFKIETHRHVLALIMDWAIIALAIYGCLQFFNPVTYLLAVIIIGARMHALAILMHDATHFRFLRNRKWNDLITNLVTMYPLFTSIELYRQNHLRHHRHLNTDHDPDWVAKLGVKEFTFPKTKAEFLWTLFTYLILYRGVKDAIWFLKRFQAPSAKQVSKSTDHYKKIFYLALIIVLTVFGWWPYFLLFWFIPYLSTFFMFQYIRSVAEHFGDLGRDHDLESSRTVKANWIEKFFMSPHNVGYHLEHHLYPGVPFYHLPKLHELLMQDETYNKHAHITKGYTIGLLNELA
jgi:fatty acid desaturase